MSTSNVRFDKTLTFNSFQQSLIKSFVCDYSTLNIDFGFQLKDFTKSDKCDFYSYLPRSFENMSNFDGIGSKYSSFNFNVNVLDYSFFLPKSFNIDFKNSSTVNDTKCVDKVKKEDVSKNISNDDKALKEKWISKKPNLTDEFYKKVVEISKRLKCDPNALMAVMNSESGINHTAVNKHSGATGLIQFMPATARDLGTTTEKLKAMSSVEQLNYVEKYLKRQKKAAGFTDDMQLSAGDLYALIFLPARAKRSVLTTEDEKFYAWNKGLDRDKDGTITKNELDARVMQDFMA